MPLTKGQIAALKTIAAARTPESYVAGSTPLNRSHTRYSADIDISNASQLRQALDAAEAFVSRMPTDQAGLLFISPAGEVVQPDPERLSDYTAHAGQRRGHWPSSSEIAAAMMTRYPQSQSTA